jgi:hypothetical protein
MGTLSDDIFDVFEASPADPAEGEEGILDCGCCMKIPVRHNFTLDMREAD